MPNLPQVISWRQPLSITRHNFRTAKEFALRKSSLSPLVRNLESSAIACECSCSEDMKTYGHMWPTMCYLSRRLRTTASPTPLHRPLCPLLSSQRPLHRLGPGAEPWAGDWAALDSHPAGPDGRTAGWGFTAPPGGPEAFSTQLGRCCVLVGLRVENTGSRANIISCYHLI